MAFEQYYGENRTLHGGGHRQNLRGCRQGLPSHVALPDNTASDQQEQYNISVNVGDWTYLWDSRFLDPLPEEMHNFLSDLENEKTIYSSFTNLRERLAWTPEELRAQSESDERLRDALVKAKKAWAAAKGAIDHAIWLLKLDKDIREQEEAARQEVAQAVDIPKGDEQGGDAQGGSAQGSA